MFPENGNDFHILAFSPFPFHSVESQWVRQTHLQRTPKSPLCLLALLENSENLAIQPKVLATTGQTDRSAVWLSTLPTKSADFLVSTCVAPFECETLGAHYF